MKDKRIIKKLYYLTCQYGILRIRPKKGKTIRNNLFTAFVHKGWKKSQKIVLKKILEIENEIKILKKDLKKAKSKHEREVVKKLNNEIRRTEYNKAKYQMVINSIVWNICGLDHHVIRRFFFDGDINNISKDSISKCTEFINQTNKDKYKIAIYADLTTFVHVGDVIIFNPKTGLLEIKELKEGKVNETCREILTNASEENLSIEQVATQLPKKTSKQLSRMAKQDWRIEKVLESIKQDEGIDIGTELPLKVSKDRQYIFTYDNRIIKLYNQLKKKKWAIDFVDDCLSIGLYRDIHMAETAFKFWVNEEDKNAIIIDYRQVFLINTARPPFSLELPPQVIKKLVNEEIFLKLSLNFSKWIELMKKIYSIKIDFETRKNTAKLLQINKEIFTIDNKAIRIEDETSVSHLGFGYFSKIFFDFYSPIDYGRVLLVTD